jgi:hypothetical protein
MRIVTGKIVVVQESRFRLVSDDGQGKLFTLAHDAGIEPQDLPDLQRAQTRVSVHFTPSPDRLAGVAHRLTEARGRKGAP